MENRKRNWKDFFKILGIASMYLVGGMTLAMSSAYLAFTTEHHWLIWIYRLLAPLSTMIFLLILTMAFQALNDR